MFRFRNLVFLPAFLCAPASLLSIIAPALAHHTFVTKYDSSKLVTISGTVDSVSYSNPHIFFSVGGWSIETEGVAAASGKGLTRERLKESAKVTVRGWKARDGSSAMGLHSITFSGGPTVTVRGSAR
jgi:hypothetical protein